MSAETVCNMKYIICIFLVAVGLVPKCQESGLAGTQNRVFIAAGSHLNLWSFYGLSRGPVNLSAEVVVCSRHAIGMGYSYEGYKRSPSFMYLRSVLGENRSNFRLRYCYYFSDPQKAFAHYIGGSAGISVWTWDDPKNNNSYIPLTGQIFFGLKFQVLSFVFTNLEFGLGPPYFARGALGFSF